MALTSMNLQKAAQAIGVEPCFIKAVAVTESGNRGFDQNGRLVVRFERHVFQRELKKRGVGQGLVTAAGKLAGTRWDTLNAAISLHEEAALCSTSFGIFQIMGFNHALCGFDSVHSFVQAQAESEENQLEAFCAFARHEKMLACMRNLDFAAFARRYNGPAYAANNYDEKLRKAYDLCRKEMTAESGCLSPLRSVAGSF